MATMDISQGDRLAWNVGEVGALLGISRNRAYELVAAGDIPSLRLGRRVVVPKAALEAFLATATPGGAA